MKDLPWFIVSSYRFVAPVGFIEHVRFACYLPIAFARYVKLTRESE